MATINRFEDLIAWQKARVLSREVYRASNAGEFARDFGLRDQIRRAVVSVMSNVAEGFERGGRKGSCGEVRSQLYVALDAGYLDEKRFASLIEMAEEVGRIVGGLRVSVGAMRNRGK